MGRKELDITKESLGKALEEFPTQKLAADSLGCSQGTISNKIKKFGLGPKVIAKTPRDPKKEQVSFTWDEVKKILLKIQDENSKTVGYEKVEIEIESNGNILFIPISDLHIGSRYTYSRELIEIIELIKNNPQVLTGFNGDLADNYNTSAYKSGQIEQVLQIQKQKAIIETLVKELEGNILWFINGCHDEWSYFNDGFDLAQYLAHKDQQGYYMGHHGRVDIILNGIKYRTFVIHNTFRNSSINEGHGLKWVCREHVSYDIAIKAHNHKAHVEEFFMRGKKRYAMACGSFKGQDRNGSKKGYPPTGRTTPGFLLNAKKKEIILDIDYRNLVKYL